ncbi:hypothetical protein GW17_00026931 [Ensete ventricosum]|nr:hypothetical protein GW17_00026931 [Ensete ventricosum]
MAPYGPKVLTALALAPHDVVRGIHDAAVPGRPYLRQPLRAEKRSPSEAGPPIITSICFSMGPFGRGHDTPRCRVRTPDGSDSTFSCLALRDESWSDREA